MLPKEAGELEERRMLEPWRRGRAPSGTPFVTFYTPQEILRVARDAGIRDVRHVSSAQVAERYFAGSPDGFRPSSI